MAIADFSRTLSHSSVSSSGHNHNSNRPQNGVIIASRMVIHFDNAGSGVCWDVSALLTRLYSALRPVAHRLESRLQLLVYRIRILITHEPLTHAVVAR